MASWYFPKLSNDDPYFKKKIFNKNKKYLRFDINWVTKLLKNDKFENQLVIIIYK